MKKICSIYQSPRKPGMYLYVLKADALARVPDELLKLFGPPRHSFDVVLTAERKLASEDIHLVLANLESRGFHLQMPPAEDDYIQHWPEELLTRNDPA